MMTKNFTILLFAAFTIVNIGVLPAQELYRMPKGIQSRWASPENPLAEKGKGGMESYGRKGRAAVKMAPGDTLVLAQENAGVSGIIHRIWLTMVKRDAKMLSGMKLEFYWDQAEKPAVSAPIGYFFGMGLGKMVPFESALLSSPEGKSFNSFFQMPFKDGMKMLLINETDEEQRWVFYDVNYSVVDMHDEDILYFHAWYNRVDSSVIRQDFQFLPKISGRGRFLGVVFGMMANQGQYYDSWWGEGEVKIFLDGDTDYPSLCGTGTEDYVGTGFSQGKYDHLYQGSHFTDPEKLHYCFYRWHIPDPIWFYTDIKATIQQIGGLGGLTSGLRKKFAEANTKIFATDNSTEPIDVKTHPGVNFERGGDDWASCVYFYLDKPENNLPIIDNAMNRMYRLQ